MKITHSFGFKTYYAHLNEVLIKAGSFVKRGSSIARTGNSGVSTGPHLHYEVRFLEKPIDPMNFARWDMRKTLIKFSQKERSVAWQSLLATQKPNGQGRSPELRPLSHKAQRLKARLTLTATYTLMASLREVFAQKAR